MIPRVYATVPYPPTSQSTVSSCYVTSIDTRTTISPILQQYRVTRMSRRSIRNDARAAFIDRFERWPHKPSRISSTSKVLVDTSMNQLPDRPIATPINNRSEIGSR